MTFSIQEAARCGLGYYPQQFTESPATVSMRGPLTRSDASLESSWHGTGQSRSIEIGGPKSLHGSGLSPFRSVAAQLDAGLAAVERLKQLRAKSENLGRHDRERRWLAAHRDEFRGRWIALDGDTLLADGASSKDVFAKVSEYKPTPLVIEIPEQEASFPGW